MSELGGTQVGGGARVMRRERRARGWYVRSEAILALLIAALSGGLIWLVTIYAGGLRDPRYLDGWILAGGMAVQLVFHIAIKTARLSPKSVVRWRRLHICLGYLLIAAFVSHSDFSLPESGFEWALSAGFVLVTLSGIFGTYLTSSMRARRERGLSGGDDQIAARRAELAQAVQLVIAESDAAPVDAVLPAPPFHAWIRDLYANHLKGYFEGRGSVAAHLIGSERPLVRVTDEIDALARYVDRQHQDKLDTLKALAIEKYRLDFNSVQIALTRGWLYVHVPVTYALIVLSVVHVLVVYAFSSGVW